jgi:phospholipase/lecithinase/hemolysin
MNQHDRHSPHAGPGFPPDAHPAAPVALVLHSDVTIVGDTGSDNGQHPQATLRTGRPPATRREPGYSYDTTAATTATPTTANAVDDRMIRSAVFMVHHYRPARTPP